MLTVDMDMNAKIADAIGRIAEGIRALPPVPEYRGQAPRVFVVGGFVRDERLGRASKDVDLEVYGVSAEALEGLLEDLFPGRMNVVGRAFGILKVFIGEGVDLDVAIPRRESKSGKGHAGFAVTGDPTMDIREALRRRDFTINAMARDAKSGELVDPFGGADDLRNRILRIVDPATFPDDPLRVYRAVQFAARFELTLDPATFELLRSMVARGDLLELSKERVTEEVKKLLLKAGRPSRGFELARELGIVERHYPELHALIGIGQEPEWHPEGDVWTHNLMVVDHAAEIIRQPGRNFTEEEKLHVMLGALCHDLGKPATTQMVDGRIRSPGHEDAGVLPTKTLLGRWSLGEAAEDAAVKIVKDHLKPSALAKARAHGELDDAQYANAVRRLLTRLHPVSWRVFLAATESDARGRAFPKGPPMAPYATGEMMRAVIEEQQFDGEGLAPLLQGRDLLEMGMKPGPGVGAILQEVEDARDRGEITTKDEALAFARKKLS